MTASIQPSDIVKLLRELANEGKCPICVSLAVVAEKGEPILNVIGAGLRHILYHNTDLRKRLSEQMRPNEECHPMAITGGRLCRANFAGDNACARYGGTRRCLDPMAEYSGGT